MDPLFTLVSQLARRSPVTRIAAPKWLVQRHRLGPLVARAGDASFRPELVRATLDWAQLSADVTPVVETLNAAGIRVAVLKGMAYARGLYAVPAERPMSDVDLMVPAEARPAAEALLRGLGFARMVPGVLHHATAWVRDELAIDLHWNIIGHGRSAIDLDAVWSRMRPGWPGAAEQLDPVDALVFHLVHMSRSRLRLPLIHVIDSARLREHADLDEAVARAEGWQLGAAVRLAARFCDAVLADAEGPPVGLLGPSHDAVLLLDEPGLVHKALFDVAMAGSPRQLVSRILHAGANRVSSLRRSSRGP